MLSFIKETQDIWQYLSHCTKPIVIYGMGDGAIKILNTCKKYNIEIKEIFASDEYVRGHSFLGYTVKNLAQVEQDYKDFIILLAFAAFEEGLVKKVYSIAEKHELYAPDVPVVGDGLFTMNYLLTHEDQFLKVYNALTDNLSKKVYKNILNFKVSGKIDYLKDISTTRKEDYTQLLPLNAGISYVDLGAYDGDTICEVMNIQPNLSAIYALEPDVKNFKKLEKNTQSINNCNIYNIGAYSTEKTLYFNNKSGRNSALAEDGKTEIKVNSVDNILKGSKADYIKFDVEGAEFEAVLGCANTISKYKPALGIAAYHRNEDLFALPLLIKKLNSEYKIYIRHNHYIPAWETIFYAI